MNLLDRDKIIHWALLLVVFLFCFTDLSLKPIHVDESVNGFFVSQIWENGFFTYDPRNYHGPFLFYLFQISEKIFGFGVHSFRIVTALFTLLTVWLVLRSRTVLGSYPSLFVALALGLSPGMIFFGRSAIHESAFVFFQILWMVGFLKLKEETGQQGLLMFFTGILGCVLLKETFVILGIAFLLAWIWIEISPKILSWINKKVDSPARLEFTHFRTPLFFKISFTVVMVWLVLVTGFFHHWKGASDFFVALMPWLKTGVGGSGHDKPFYYWGKLFWRYEWVAIIGLVIACTGLFSRSWKMRFFSSLSLVNGLIYSLIPYKTPWCIISILWPFIFVAGFWFESIFVRVRPKNTFIFLLSLGLAGIVIVHSAVTSYKLNFRNYTNSSEPYVYVQTKNDFKTIEHIIKIRIQSNPDFHNMTVLIKLNDPWPLPWVFSRFPHVRYGDYREVNNPEEDIIFLESTADDRNLAGLYWYRQIELRDAREPIHVYLKRSTFDEMDLPGFSMVHVHGIKDF